MKLNEYKGVPELRQVRFIFNKTGMNQIKRARWQPHVRSGFKGKRLKWPNKQPEDNLIWNIPFSRVLMI